ncbi:MAG: hypothetical protein GX998_07600 [Firmicutes bacterium]|nr:hypothetical protein [Bacillota bacterium]
MLTSDHVKNQGHITEFILWNEYCPDRAQRRAKRLWVNDKAFPTEKRFLYKRLVLFSFGVTLVADTKMSSLWSILLDPCEERPMPVVNLSQKLTLLKTGSIPGLRFSQRRNQGRKDVVKSQGKRQLNSGWQKGPRWQPWGDHQDQLAFHSEDYELCRLYVKACQYLQDRLPQAARSIEAGVRSRYKQEQERLQQYYRQLGQEAMYPLRKLFRRLAVASVRADLARSLNTQAAYASQISSLKQEIGEAEARYQAYLEEIKQDMTWRLGELDARYAARLQVSLVGVACIWAPYVEFTFHIPQLAEDHTYLYNCMADRFADTLCDACHELADGLILCSCGNVVCRSCHDICPGCGQKVCRGCAQSKCHICEAYVCDECTASCPWDASASCLLPSESESLARTKEVCTHCFDTSCHACMSLTNYGWRWA